jgi:anthraniloyl-CoA monooxygenase
MKISVIGGGPGGLYFALLAKKRWPRWDVELYERNRADDTFGFGVVFSDATLGTFRDYDAPSYESIRRSFAYWDDVEIVYKGSALRCGGNGFCGCSRVTLLGLLQQRCRELGVALHFQAEASVADFPESDLVVAADGINSRTRETYAEHFKPTVDLRPNKFVWLGSTRPLDAFKYFFKESEHGILLAHTYQYEKGASTWIIETNADTWERSGFDRMDEAQTLRSLEALFAEELDGHGLIANRSQWRNFPNIRNATWVMGKVVLVGDAKASAHFSIGSGTKLAMEDAIALFDALRTDGSVTGALALYDSQRREGVERTQHAADVSLAWFENMRRYWSMDPPQFAFGLISRSKQITYENVRLRDPEFLERVTRWFADKFIPPGFEVQVRNPPPPMFTPFALRGMRVENRVVVSPMDQYMAIDGVPNDWHLVHLGSRAVGGAGLVFVEMTCTSPEARISPGCTGLWNDAQAQAFVRIVDFCHVHSAAKLAMQLGHSGRKGSTQLGWERPDYPLASRNWELVAPSPLPYLPLSQTPREMGRADMDRIRDDFVRSAKYADQVGFDLLELHMAHGYLLSSFISPLTNLRKDEYGGPIANRLRYPLEVFRAVREVWPEEKPMSIRISAADWAPGGLSDEDLLALARAFRDAGVDLIDVSTGQVVPHQKPIYGRMYQTPFADKIRNELAIATMAVGNITSADQVNTIVISGRADLVALARPHLVDPYFTLHAAAWHQHWGQFWPKPYWPGRDQAYRLAVADRAEWTAGRIATRPPSHEVKEERARDERPGAASGGGPGKRAA